MYKPDVSVVIANYNSGEYLLQTVKSILDQTYQTFEIVIVDDASTDNSVNLIQELLKDDRIKVLTNKQNIGQAVSANIGIAHSSGEYIVRIDADDVAEPTRLEKQIAYMEANPAIHLCFTDFYCFRDNGEEFPSWNVNLPDKFFRVSLLFSNNFCHSTSIYRRSFWNEYQLNYKEDFPTTQDYDLWSRMVEHTEIGYIREKLVGYRIHETNVSIKKRKSQQDNAKRVIVRQLHQLGIQPTDVEYFIHRHIFPARSLATADFIPKLNKWIQKLIESNRRESAYDQPAFEDFLTQQFLLVKEDYRSKVARLSKKEVIKLSLKKILRWPSIGEKTIRLLNQK